MGASSKPILFYVIGITCWPNLLITKDPGSKMCGISSRAIPIQLFLIQRSLKPVFFKSGVNLLLNSANRTVKTQEDIIPEFNKLVHPNGICLKGTWLITEDNPYTGYFNWLKIGRIEYDESVASHSCDHRLQFNHPKFKDNLN